MNIAAVVKEVVSGHVFLRRAIARAGESANRFAFITALLESGLAQPLVSEALSAEALAAELGLTHVDADAFTAWLGLGVKLGVLRREAAGYRIHSRMVKALAESDNDALAAMAQCIPIEQQFVLDALRGIRSGCKFAHDGKYSALVARLSRQLEPFALAALRRSIPAAGQFRVLDVGCGSAGYLKCLAERNPMLAGVGLERIPAVVDQARANVRRWKLDDRVRILNGDAGTLPATAEFDLALLNLVIHYTPLAERTELFTQVHRTLKPGGAIFIANPVRRTAGGFELLNLWALMTEGCGPIPRLEEIERALREAGFRSLRSAALIPGSGFVAVWGRKTD